MDISSSQATHSIAAPFPTGLWQDGSSSQACATLYDHQVKELGRASTGISGSLSSAFVLEMILLLAEALPN
jgi:hypothetical protein